MLRRRPGQILDAIVGAAACVLVTTSLSTWITKEQPARVLEALTKVLPDGSRSQSLNHVVAAAVAFLVVADIAGRTRLRVAAGLAVTAVLVTSVLSGTVTLLSVVESLLIGGTVGLAVRYAFGSFTRAPTGSRSARRSTRAGSTSCPSPPSPTRPATSACTPRTPPTTRATRSSSSTATRKAPGWSG